MRPARYIALVAVAGLVACSQAAPEQQIVDDAAAALGGAERIRAAKTLAIEGSGTQYNLGQDVVPGASGQTFTVTSLTRHIDVAGERSRTTLTRAPNFTYFQGPAEDWFYFLLRSHSASLSAWPARLRWKLQR
jgi:hypothetical protein